MVDVISFILRLIGILLGAYVGIYVLFVKGIIDIVNAIKANPINTSMLTWGIVKSLNAAPVGWLIFFIFWAAASAIGLIND